VWAAPAAADVWAAPAAADVWAAPAAADVWAAQHRPVPVAHDAGGYVAPG
jgi:hypothetical protein